MSESRTTYLEGLFPVYLGLGPTRTIAVVAHRHNISVMELTKHAQAHNWISRASEHQQQAIDRACVSITDQVVEAQNRHMELLNAIRAKAMTAVQGGLSFEKMSDAVSAIEKIIKLERTVLGLDATESVSTADKQRAALAKKMTPDEPTQEAAAEFEFDPNMKAPELPGLSAQPALDTPMKDPAKLGRPRGAIVRADQVKQLADGSHNPRIRKTALKAARELPQSDG